MKEIYSVALFISLHVFASTDAFKAEGITDSIVFNDILVSYIH